MKINYGFTNKKIREILSNEARTTNTGEEYWDIAPELEQELYRRSNAKAEICPIEQEIKNFKKKLRFFKKKLKINGDSEELRRDIRALIASYRDFEAHIYS